MLWVMNQKYLAGVIAVVLNDAGEVLLLRHTYRRERAWGLPAGWLRGREDPILAVRRELAEESGLSAQVLYPLRIDPGARRPQLDIVYVCRPDGGTFRPSPEVDACGWFPLDRLPDVPDEQREYVRQALAGRR
jgi:8-oxo-dGTP diphosphatase